MAAQFIGPGDPRFEHGPIRLKRWEANRYPECVGAERQRKRKLKEPIEPTLSGTETEEDRIKMRDLLGIYSFNEYQADHGTPEWHQMIINFLELNDRIVADLRRQLGQPPSDDNGSSSPRRRTVRRRS